MKDLKEGLSSARKADITHVRKAFMTYTSRPCEYGSAKYERANFLRAATPVPEGAPIAGDFVRLRQYLRAATSHIADVLDSMERHQAGDPNLLDVDGMRRAAYAVDTDVTPGAKVGASMLPHVAHACASLMMAVTQAANAGLLPLDPGTPWVQAPARERFEIVALNEIDDRPRFFADSLDAEDHLKQFRAGVGLYQFHKLPPTVLRDDDQLNTVAIVDNGESK